jgi:hypothetical protein
MYEFAIVFLLILDEARKIGGPLACLLRGDEGGNIKECSFFI